MQLKNHTRSAAPDDYLNLVRRLPLRPIRSGREHVEAVRMLTALVGRPGGTLSEGDRDYVEALSLFVKNDDERGCGLRKRWPLPLETLRFLMREHAMNTEALGKILGSQSAASLVLNGKRELSKTHIRKLATHFKVDPGVFL